MPGETKPICMENLDLNLCVNCGDYCAVAIAAFKSRLSTLREGYGQSAIRRGIQPHGEGEDDTRLE